MSYSGRRQLWCAEGHYWVISCWDDDPVECAICRSPVAYRNGVDDTNGEAWGYIKPVEKVAAVRCQCVDCGHSHIKTPATYIIPQLRS